jgi:hypothetical protein
VADFKPWDRTAFPGGYHEQLNAEARAEARATLALALTTLALADTGTPDTLQYLAERAAPKGPA